MTRKLLRANLPATVGSLIWLVIVAVPVYYMLLSSLRGPDEYLDAGGIQVPDHISFANYQKVWAIGFADFAVNSLLVTLFTVVLVVATALPAAYCFVRNTGRVARIVFSAFLLGLAIAAQAVIVPIYLIITRLDLYDTYVAIVLPTAAFSLPMAVVVLTSALRDIPPELYEAMMVDGAGPFRMFVRLVLPLGRPAMVTTAIFSGLNAWNGYLFPLVLTQSTENRVLPLGLSVLQGQYGTDVPNLMAAVVLSTIPVAALYAFGRRFLLRGLMAGFGK
jgi:xylobiose transport system permease protein